MSRTKPDPGFRLGRSASGLGLFAGFRFRAGERVIEYTGERISGEEADRRGGRYLFHVDAAHAIDATGRENLARYINHACRPNCEARAVGRRIFIYARRAIEPGDGTHLSLRPGLFPRLHRCRRGAAARTCVRRAARVADGQQVAPGSAIDGHQPGWLACCRSASISACTLLLLCAR